MTTRTRFALVSLAAAALWGCLEDPTPDTVRFRMDGPAGAQAEIIYSTQFLAGQDAETGLTEVNVLLSDTITTTLPLDTTLSILPERIFFVQAIPVDAEELSVSIRVDAEGRNLFDGSGDIFSADPWRFVYLFNRNLLTVDVEVVI